MKRRSLVSQLDAGFGSSSSNPIVQAKNASGFHFVKPEPSEPVIPRKRPSATGLSGTVKTETFPLDTTDAPSTPTSSKKIKAEIPKTPLALVNWNTASSNQSQASAPGLSIAEATAQLNEVQRKLTQTEINFNKLARKPRRTKAEMTRFGMLSRDIDRLQASKNDYAAIIASLAVKHKPFPGALVSSRVVPHIPAQLPQSFSNPAFLTVGEQKPVVHPPQPIASGSNVRLPDAHMAYRDVKMDSDDEDGMSSDERELLNMPLSAAGPVADLGGYGENFDADGNFHGRGRDKFVGPQAKGDEYVAC
jgi:hypothetical protein